MADTETENLADLLKEMSGGEFHESATKRLEKLVQTLHERVRNGGGKPKGKLTLVLTFKLDRGVIEIEGDVKVTEPATVHGRDFRYGTDDGRLVKEDPRNLTLALESPRQPRDATPDRRNVRDIRERAANDE